METPTETPMETPTPPPSVPETPAPAPPPARTPPAAPMPEVVPIALDHPVEADGATIEGLSMRRPRVADQLAAEKAGGGDGAREVALFANLCEVSPETVRRLALSDYFEMQRVFRGFLSHRRPTSAAPPRS